MTLHGLVLTGGSSTRMGRDKAGIEVGGVPQARRVAALLTDVATAAVEVGPGYTDLPVALEDPPGSGPLGAVVAGWRELVRRTGEKRPVLVLACDLPALDARLLAWRAGAGVGAAAAAAPRDPTSAQNRSVVPVVDGRPQPLCARWSVSDLERAAAQLAAGERSLRQVFGPDAFLAGPAEWSVAAAPGAFADVDTPVELARLGIAPPPSGDDWVALSRTPIDPALATSWVTLPSCGAVVTFLGTVRDHAEGRTGVELLSYEAYERPALDRMARIVGEARQRWSVLGRVAVVHRLGDLALTDVAVLVAVSAPHRGEAFTAGQFVIDTVKTQVPIWKYERWAGGEDWGTCAHPVEGDTRR
jgi:molybdopterin synthase catalytic subunit